MYKMFHGALIKLMIIVETNVKSVVVVVRHVQLQQCGILIIYKIYIKIIIK